MDDLDLDEAGTEGWFSNSFKKLKNSTVGKKVSDWFGRAKKKASSAVSSVANKVSSTTNAIKDLAKDAVNTTK